MIDFTKIDKVIHEKGRLSTLTLLASRVEWGFQDLKAHLKMSDGNLITHLRTLHEKGYVSISKDHAVKRRTLYALTDQGRHAFQDYLQILEAIVEQGKNGCRNLGSRPGIPATPEPS